jgi:hypothetical protein
MAHDEKLEKTPASFRVIFFFLVVAQIADVVFWNCRV